MAELALRGRRDSMQAIEQATASRRASVAAFLSTAPGFTEPVVEHIQLFRVKGDADPVQTQAMLDAFHALRTLDGVLELTVGSALSVFTNLSVQSSFLSYHLDIEFQAIELMRSPRDITTYTFQLISYDRRHPYDIYLLST